MYHEFDYKLYKLTLIDGVRWLEEKNRSNHIYNACENNEQMSGELHITFCTIF